MFEAVRLFPHDIVRMLEHAKRATHLLARRTAERRTTTGWFADVATTGGAIVAARGAD